MKRRRFDLHNLIWIIPLLALILSPLSSAGAQSAAPILEAEAAFGGNFKYGEWLPVWVDLENQGQDVEAEVRVSVSSGEGTRTFAVPISLPSGSRKRVPVYVLPNNFSRELDVRLVSGRDLLASQKVQIRPQPNISYFIGIIAPERGALSFLSAIDLPGQERPKVLVDLPLSGLPERLEGLRSFDLLVINDTDTSTLSPEQAAVLQNWVNQGGRLVVGGGPGAQATAAGLPEGLLPFQPQSSIELHVDDLSGLAEFAGVEAIRVPGPFVAASGELGAGRVLAGNSNLPLVVEHSYGDGMVDFVALDLSAAPFDAWTGATAFWQTLVSPGAAYPDGLPPDMSPRQMQSGQIPYALSNMPVLDLPSTQSLALLLGFYILLVGPINYLVLRWRKSMHLAWVSIPLITLIFSGGAFSLGYLMRGTDLVLNKIAVVELQPGGSASVTSYVGLFSPAQTSYEIQVDNGGLLSPVSNYYDPWSSGNPNTGNEMVFVQGSPGSVRGLSVNQFSMQSFMVEGSWPDFGQIRGDLELDDGRLTGTVTNDSGQALSDVTVILGRNFTRIGDLQPGEQTEVDLKLESSNQQRFGPPISYMLFEREFNQPNPSGPPRDVEIKRMILEGLFDNGPWSKLSSRMPTGKSSLGQGALLLAWMKTAPPEVRIADTTPGQQTTALVYTPLSYRLPQEGQITLPPGLIQGRLVEMPQEGGMCGDPSTASVYLFRGDAVFEFQLPEDISGMDVQSLQLDLWSDRGWWTEPGTSVYDWSAEEWAELDGVIQGTNILEDAQSMVNDQGLVKVKLSSADGTEACYFVGLGFEAERRNGGGG